MLRFSFSKKEAFFLLLALESYLPEAEENDSDTIESLLEKLSSHSLSAPFSSASQARKAGLSL